MLERIEGFPTLSRKGVEYHYPKVFMGGKIYFAIAIVNEQDPYSWGEGTELMVYGVILESDEVLPVNLYYVQTLDERMETAYLSEDQLDFYGGFKLEEVLPKLGDLERG